MTGYAITQIEVTNPEDYKEYLAKVTDIVTKFGGEYLVRGGEFQCFEGEWKYPRTVVIKFTSYEKALEWYNSDEYKPVRQIRLDNSVGNFITTVLGYFHSPSKHLNSPPLTKYSPPNFVTISVTFAKYSL